MRWFAPLLLILYGCTPSGSTEPPRTGLVDLAGQLEDRRIKEASGIAASTRRDDVLWIINDGGAKPIIHATTLTGKIHGQLRIDKVKNRDWEDLATVMIDEKPFLVVAEIGDNEERHKTSRLYVIEEPAIELEDDRKLRERADKVIEFEYADGPRDAESLAIDGDEKLAYILTKRDLPPRLYSVPLQAEPGERVTARFHGPVLSLPPPRRSDIEIAGITKDWYWQPTAMDFSRDGRHAVVLTYEAIYLYRRHDGQSWYQALSSEPLGLPINRIRAAEAVAFSADGRTLFLTVEAARGAPLYRVDISGALAKMASTTLLPP